MAKLIFRRHRRFPLSIRLSVSPLAEIAIVTSAGAILGGVGGYYTAAVGGLDDASMHGYSCMGVAGIVTLWASLAAVANRYAVGAEETAIPKPPAPMPLDLPTAIVRREWVLTQRWQASMERQFSLPFSLLQQVAAYLLTGRQFVYREVSPRILTRSQWDSVYPALVSSRWVTVSGKRITGVSAHGEQMLGYIAAGAPPDVD